MRGTETSLQIFRMFISSVGASQSLLDSQPTSAQVVFLSQEHTARENHLVRIDAVVDELWRPINSVHESGKRSAIGDSWAAVWQIERQPVHAPGGQVHCLEGMVFL